MSRLRSFFFFCLLVSVLACHKSDPSTEDFYYSILTNDISRLEKYLNGHDHEKFVLLPIEHILELRDDGTEVISDPLLQDYIKCVKLNYHFNEKESLRLLEDILPKINVSEYNLLKFEANAFYQNLNLEQADKNSFLSFYKPHNLNTIYGTYQYLTYIKFLARKYLNNEQSYLALASFDYAL